MATRQTQQHFLAGKPIVFIGVEGDTLSVTYCTRGPLNLPFLEIRNSDTGNLIAQVITSEADALVFFAELSAK